MTSFSSLLSSIGVQQQAPQPTPTALQGPAASKVATKPLVSGSPGPALKPNNVAAGVKRKATEAPADVVTGASQAERRAPNGSQPGTGGGRFQLSTKSSTGQKTAPVIARSVGERPNSSPLKRGPANLPSKPAAPSAASITPKAPAAPAPAKRGFASILEKAKAAQEAAKAAGPRTIIHKPVQRLSKREKQRLLEEHRAQQKAAKANRAGVSSRAQLVTRAPGDKAAQKKAAELSYQGTMKKKAQPLSYKGTMRAETGDGKATAKKKSQPEGKYGGYASWSELDDAEDDEEDGWDSDASSDMEGGFDDVEREEMEALRAAKREDQVALEEEERHRREKLERKRKLELLSKNAAAKRKY